MAAVAANNIVALNKEHDVFDSKKKIKIATAEAAAAKVQAQSGGRIVSLRCSSEV